MDSSSYHSNTGIESNENQKSITLKEAFKSFSSLYLLIIPQLLFIVVLLPVFYFLLENIFIYVGIGIGIIFLFGIIAIAVLVSQSKSAAKNRDLQTNISETSLSMGFARFVMSSIPLRLFLVSICVFAFIAVPAMDFYDSVTINTIRVVAIIAILTLIGATAYQINKEWNIYKEAIQKL